MNLLELHLTAFGPFTNRVLDFSDSGQPAPLVMVYGKNEAGKSSALRAMEDFRFEIPARSGDDFVHHKTKLRIGAKVADRTGTIHHLVRRKGNKDTLLSYSEDFSAELAPTSEAVAMMLTAGLNRDEFKTMYGLDHARLREGAQELLKGSGNVGSALFTAASGAKSIGQLLSQLEERSKAIYAKNAKSGLINKALKDYTESQSEMGRLAVKPRAWAEAKKTHDKAVETLDATKRSAQAVNKRLLALKDLSTARLPVEQKRAAQKILDELAYVPTLPPEFSARRVAVQTKLKTLGDTQDQIAGELSELQVQLNLIVEDPAAIAHEHQIADLKGRTSLLQQAMEQISAARLEEEFAETELTQAQQAVASHDHTQVGELPSHAKQLLAKANQNLTKVTDISREVRRLQSTAVQVPAETNAAQAGQLHTIALLMPGLESEGKRARDLKNKITAADEELNRRMAEIGLSRIEAQAPILAGEVQAEESKRTQAEAAVQDAMAGLENATRTREQAETSLNSLLAGGQVVTREDVTEARTKRDLGWQLVRAHMIGSEGPTIESEAFRSGMALDDAYWRSVLEADQLVDSFAANAAAAAKVAQAQVNLAAAQQAENRLKSKLQDAIDQLNDIDSRWNERAAAVGLPGLLPSDVLTWLEQYAEIRALNNENQETTLALNQLAQYISTEKDEIIAFLESMGHTWPADQKPKLAQINGVIQGLISELSSQMQEAAALKAVNFDRALRLSELEFDLAEATREWESSHSEALAVLTALGLENAENTASAYAQAEAAIDRIESLQAAQSKHQQATARVNSLASVISGFDNEAGSLATVIGLDLPDDTPTGAKIEALHNRLTKALTNQQSKIHLGQIHAAAAQRLSTTMTQLSSMQAELTDMCAAAGVTNPDELPAVEQHNERRRSAQAQLAEAQTRLMSLTAVRDEGLDAIEEKVANEDWDCMDEAQEQCQRELDELERQRDAQTAIEETARQTLRAIDSSDNAAYASSQMDAAATAVRGQIGAWAQARLASALLNEAIKRFREKAQGPMLSLASGYFSQMTGGDFTGLASDDDSTTPALLASRASGSAVRLEFLSEGTCDQVYLSLRMAALDLRQQAGVFMPVVLDDVLMTSDDARASNILKAIKAFSARHQVMVFTHHEHLIDLGLEAVPDLKVVRY